MSGITISCLDVMKLLLDDGYRVTPILGDNKNKAGMLVNEEVILQVTVDEDSFVPRANYTVLSLSNQHIREEGGVTLCRFGQFEDDDDVQHVTDVVKGVFKTLENWDNSASIDPIPVPSKEPVDNIVVIINGIKDIFDKTGCRYEEEYANSIAGQTLKISSEGYPIMDLSTLPENEGYVLTLVGFPISLIIPPVNQDVKKELKIFKAVYESCGKIKNAIENITKLRRVGLREFGSVNISHDLGNNVELLVNIHFDAEHIDYLTIPSHYDGPTVEYKRAENVSDLNDKIYADLINFNS